MGGFVKRFPKHASENEFWATEVRNACRVSFLSYSIRRRLPDVSKQSELPLLQPQVGEPTLALPSQGGVPTCLWVAMLLSLVFLVYWFVVRRFKRPGQKQLSRDSCDLETG